MGKIESEVSNILLDYEKVHVDAKELHAQWHRIELLLRIVAYEASHGLDTGIDFEDEV